MPFPPGGVGMMPPQNPLTQPLSGGGGPMPPTTDDQQRQAPTQGMGMAPPQQDSGGAPRGAMPMTNGGPMPPQTDGGQQVSQQSTQQGGQVGVGMAPSNTGATSNGTVSTQTSPNGTVSSQATQPAAGGGVGMMPPQQSAAPQQQGGMVGMAPPQQGVGMGMAPPQQDTNGVPRGAMPMQQGAPQQGGPVGVGMAPPQQNNTPPPAMGGAPGGVGMMPPQRPLSVPPPPPQPPGPPQNIEQQVLGANNRQQTSNFMNALNQIGAGGNNNFMRTAQQGQQGVNNLIDPNAAYANNGTVGQNTFRGGQNAGQVGNPFQLNLPPGGSGGMQLNGGQGPGLNINPGGLGPGAINNYPGNPPLTGGGGIQPNGLGGGAIPQGNPNPVPQIKPGMQPGTTLGQQGPGGSQLGPGVPQPQNQLQGIQLPPNMLVSDENLKTNVSPGNTKVNQFLNAIHAYNYQYKEPEKDGRGTFTSPMAQELEQTELGKQAVINTPRGKMVDYPRLGAVNLAAVSVVHREQKRLQEELDKLKGQFMKTYKRGK